MIPQNDPANQGMITNAIEILTLKPVNESSYEIVTRMHEQRAINEVQRLRDERARLMTYVRQLEREASDLLVMAEAVTTCVEEGDPHELLEAFISQLRGTVEFVRGQL